jgi:CRP-like cAMP-binding protein
MPSKSKRPVSGEGSLEIDWAGIQTDQVDYVSGAVIFAQGDPAATIMCVEAGTVRLSVVSHSGKEAVVAVLHTGHFFG